MDDQPPESPIDREARTLDVREDQKELASSFKITKAVIAGSILVVSAVLIIVVLMFRH